MDEPEVKLPDRENRDHRKPEVLPYAESKPSRRWLRILLRSAIVLVIILISGWMALYALYYFTFLSARVSVTIDNQSDEPLCSTKVFIGMTGETLLDLGDIKPKTKASGSVRFNRDLGPATFIATHGNQSFNNRMTWVLLTDNGPFEHTFTVHADKIHWESYAGSKGDAEGDFEPVSPKTAP